MENALEANIISYQISWAFQNCIFHFFANFSVTKLKPFSGENQANKSKLQFKVLTESILENGFEATLRSKPNVVNRWNCHFSVFYNFLGGKVEIIFSESDTKCSILFRLKFSTRKHLKKWFWSYLEFNNACSEPLKMLFLKIFARFWVTKLGKWGKAFKTI